MSNAYTSADEIKINEYIPSSRFRTIAPSLRELPHGRPEVPVTIQLAKDSDIHNSLPGYFSSSVFINGFARLTEPLAKVLGINIGAVVSDEHIQLNEWDDGRFLVVFKKSGSRGETNCFTTSVQVAELLKNSLHPAEFSMK